MQQTPVVREAQQGLGSPVEGLGFVHTVPCPQMLNGVCHADGCRSTVLVLLQIQTLTHALNCLLCLASHIMEMLSVLCGQACFMTEDKLSLQLTLRDSTMEDPRHFCSKLTLVRHVWVRWAGFSDMHHHVEVPWHPYMKLGSTVCMSLGQVVCIYGGAYCLLIQIEQNIRLNQQERKWFCLS